MPARTLPTVCAALLLGGCASFDAFVEGLRGERTERPEVVQPADESAELPEAPEATPVAEPEPIEDPAADLPIARVGRPLMREIQTALNDRGLSAGTVDGLVGPSTVRAIRLFKLARRMEVNPDVTPRLLDELGLTQP